MGTRLVPIKLPKNVFPSKRDTERLLSSALDELAQTARADYAKTARTWNTQPRFTVTPAVRKGDTLSAGVGTDNDIYRYVDEGTRPHIIRPRFAKALAFRGGFKAKTRVGVIGSTAGGSSGKLLYAQEVRHPGTKARGFTERIAERVQRRAPLIFARALAKSILDV